MQIEAAIARAGGANLSLETIDIEEPRDSEILVKVVATGVCHTDIVVRDGMLPTPLPVVLGMRGPALSRKSAAPSRR
jgi:aryl-alcohol dehydrogenase